MKLSIIIPAYNEEKNIYRTLADLQSELDRLSYDYEILVVCDGCRDNTCFEAKRIKSRRIRVLDYHPNRGKGYALTFGARRAQGEIVTFFDAGGDFHPDHIDRFVKLMDAFEADIVIGSKRHSASKVKVPLKRKVFSWCYQKLIRILFRLDVGDTQTGLKVFRREALKRIMPRSLVKQYAFDLELLVIAKRLGYNRIFEAPVNMNLNTANSGVNPKTIFRMLRDTLAIFYRRYVTHYYDEIPRETARNQKTLL